MIKLTSRRSSYFIAFLAIIVLLAAASYLQFKGFIPCALCILQRFVFCALGIVFLIGALVRYSLIGRIVDVLGIFFSLIGITLAGRQVWLQHNPVSGTGNCDVSLEYMLKALPLDEVMKKIFSGASECTQVGWQIMKLSLAQWSLIWFILFFLFALWQLRRS